MGVSGGSVGCLIVGGCRSLMVTHISQLYFSLTYEVMCLLVSMNKSVEQESTTLKMCPFLFCILTIKFGLPCDLLWFSILIVRDPHTAAPSGSTAIHS